MKNFAIVIQAFVLLLAVRTTSAAPVAGHCLAPDGRYYPPSPSFVTKDCSFICYCTKEGNLGCLDFCNPVPPISCLPNQKVKELRVAVAPGVGAGTCHCIKRNCVNVTVRMAEKQEQAGCTDLCPPVAPVFCPPNMKLKEISVAVAGNRSCRCVKRYCVAQGRKVCIGPGNEKYKTGETFVRADCSASCRCNEDGQLVCVPLCPKITCPKGTVLKETEIAPASKVHSGCSCRVRPKCVPAKKCVRADGRTFNFGDIYTTKDCQSKCRCRRNGVIRCTSLCHNTSMTCALGERQVTRVEAVGTDGCTCKKKRCDKPRTEKGQRFPILPARYCLASNGKGFKIGDIYIKDDCTERCKCTVNGRMKCVSLCHSVWEPCGVDDEQVVAKEPVPRTNCSCTRLTCKKKSENTLIISPVLTCTMEGHTFSGDETYIDNNCTSHCVCGRKGISECSPLCPDLGQPPKCSQGFAEKTKEIVPYAPRCACPTYKCVDLDKTCTAENPTNSEFNESNRIEAKPETIITKKQTTDICSSTEGMEKHVRHAISLRRRHFPSLFKD